MYIRLFCCKSEKFDMENESEKKNEKNKHKTWMKEQGGTRANKFHVFDNHRLLEQHKINDVVQILQVRRIILA